MYENSCWHFWKLFIILSIIVAMVMATDCMSVLPTWETCQFLLPCYLGLEICWGFHLLHSPSIHWRISMLSSLSYPSIILTRQHTNERLSTTFQIFEWLYKCVCVRVWMHTHLYFLLIVAFDITKSYFGPWWLNWQIHYEGQTRITGLAKN